MPLARLVGIFAGGNFIANFLRMMGGVLTARLVEPAVLGLFNGIGLIIGYLPVFQLGVITGFRRELPYLIGKGDGQQALALAATAQVWALFLACLSATALFSIGLWHAIRGEWRTAAGWATFGVSAWLLFFVTQYLEATYRTHSEFAKLSFARVLQSSAGVLLVVVVWVFGFYGLCLRALAVGLVALVFLWRHRPVRVRPHLNSDQLKRLLRIGAPILMVGQAYAWWGVLNQTAVLKFTGTEGLGLYALALMSDQFVSVLPLAVGQITYPRVAELYGRTGRIRPLIRYLWRPTALLVLVMVPATAASWMLLPPLTQLLLPRYSFGIPAAQWALIGAFLVSFQPVNNVFVATRRVRRYFIAIVLGAFVHGVALLWLLRDRIELAAFPQAMAVGRSAFLLACYAFLSELWFIEGTKPDNSAST